MPSDRRLNLRTYAALVVAPVLGACSGRNTPTGSAVPEPQLSSSHTSHETAKTAFISRTVATGSNGLRSTAASR